MAESSNEQPLHRRLGMTDEELAAVVAELGREPNHLELAMYSVMWSEHCSYKSSRAFLSRFPTEAPWVLVGPGEGAGVVDIGDGLAVAVRIESHNHPSAVEPYQGAATGVGGIIRDVFSMGARPIALMDPLRFGSLDDARTRYLFEGVVSGISGYGNAVGVPTVGGEVAFATPRRRVAPEHRGRACRGHRMLDHAVERTPAHRRIVIERGARPQRGATRGYDRGDDLLVTSEQRIIAAIAHRLLTDDEATGAQGARPARERGERVGQMAQQQARINQVRRQGQLGRHVGDGEVRVGNAFARFGDHGR